MLKSGTVYSSAYNKNRLLKGKKEKDGYIRLHNGNNFIYLHKLIWECVNGDIPKDENGKPYHIHHIDGNKENNSIYNLEILSPSEHEKLHYGGDKLKGENNPFYGKHHTEETKKRISESHKGMKKKVGK